MEVSGIPAFLHASVWAPHLCVQHKTDSPFLPNFSLAFFLWCSDEETKAMGIDEEGEGTAPSTAGGRCCWRRYGNIVTLIIDDV